MNDEILKHHGVDGQKWGKRNGPPYPLTPEAKAKAYGDEAKKTYKKQIKEAKDNYRKARRENRKKERLARKEAKIVAKRQKELRDAIDSTFKRRDNYKLDNLSPETREALRQAILTTKDPKDILRFRGLFTTDEIKEFNTRLQLEKKISELYVPDKGAIERITAAIDKGAKFTSSIGDWASATSKTAKEFKAIYDAFTKEDKKGKSK